MILNDFIGELCIPNDFPLDFDTFKTLTGRPDIHFGPKIGRKSVFWLKIAAQGQ